MTATPAPDRRRNWKPPPQGVLLEVCADLCHEGFREEGPPPSPYGGEARTRPPAPTHGTERRSRRAPRGVKAAVLFPAWG